MRKIGLFLVVLVVCLVIASKVISVESLNVVPNSLELSIPSGRLDTAYLVVVNLGESSLAIESDFNSQWMLVFPSQFEIPPKEAKRVLAIFFIPREENPWRKGEIIFRTKDGEKQAQLKVTVSGILTMPIGETKIKEKIESLKKEIADKDREIAALKGQATKLLGMEKRLSDYKRMVAALKGEVKFLQEEIQKKRKPRIITKPVKKPKPAEELKPLYISLKENLSAEIEKNEIQLTYQEDRIFLLVPGQISFASGKIYPKAAGLKVLQKLGCLLKGKTLDKLVQVRGHTDSLRIGKELKKKFSSNWELSVLRAAVVVGILQETGLEGKYLSAVGYSFYHPLVSNEKLEGRSQNRRIEIVVSIRGKEKGEESQ